MVVTVFTLGLGLTAAPTRGEVPPARNVIERKPLLTANIAGGKRLGRVEIKQIDLRPNQPTPRHMHPCPVVGYVAKGEINFQVAGQPPDRLQAGDAFYEPANTVVLHFDAAEHGASFVANYLLGQDETELIKML
jgi:quercetin dioxygenase-like cupin family protein